MIAAENPHRPGKYRAIGPQVGEQFPAIASGILLRAVLRRGCLAAMLCVATLSQQSCLWHRDKAGTPATQASQVSVLILPLNASLSDPTQQSLSIGSAVLAEQILLGVTDVSPVPLWRGIPAAQGVLGGSRNITPATASDLANLLSVPWAMIGEVSQEGDRYAILIDFIPAKQSMIAFRYMRDLRPELLEPKVYEALGQFLRYLRRPSARLMPVPDHLQDPHTLFDLAGAVDVEYGWFSPAVTGRSQSAFNAVAATDRDLAALLFNPGIYAVGTVAESRSDLTAAGTLPPAMPAPIEVPLNVPPPPQTPEKPAQVQVPPEAPAPDQVPPIKPLPSPPPPVGSKSSDISRWAKFVPPPLITPEASPAEPSDEKTSEPEAPTRATGLIYRLQVFASPVLEEAAEVAENLRQAGVAAEITRVRLGDKRLWYRVRIGSFKTSERASVKGDALVAVGLANEYWIFSKSSTSPPSARGGGEGEHHDLKPASVPAEEVLVQVFASFEEVKAAALAEVLRRAGLKVIIQKARLPGKGDWYRVRLIGYTSRREAVAAAERLIKQGLISEYWVTG